MELVLQQVKRARIESAKRTCHIASLLKRHLASGLAKFLSQTGDGLFARWRCGAGVAHGAGSATRSSRDFFDSGLQLPRFKPSLRTNTTKHREGG